MNDQFKESLLLHLREGFSELSIPDHMRQCFELYLTEGIEPGSFSMALLENNFKEACGKADHVNITRLKDYAVLMYNFMPSDSQGSPEKVAAWLSQFREEDDVQSNPQI